MLTVIITLVVGLPMIDTRLPASLDMWKISRMLQGSVCTITTKSGLDLFSTLPHPALTALSPQPCSYSPEPPAFQLCPAPLDSRPRHCLFPPNWDSCGYWRHQNQLWASWAVHQVQTTVAFQLENTGAKQVANLTPVTDSTQLAAKCGQRSSP